jgi:glycosyltransferase involved in cell wall biosynthesis
MMCGTPVAATRLGAATEIIDEGVTGCFPEAGGEFAAAVQRALTLDRRRVRDTAAARFSGDRMASQYLRVYEQLLGKA